MKYFPWKVKTDHVTDVSFHHQVPTVTILVCAIRSISCLESPEPEVLLQPRNFNPHPYEEGGRALPTRHGPVLFPAVGNALTSQSAVPVGLLNVGTSGVDNHPYADVARKQRIKLAGRFSAADQVRVKVNTLFLANAHCVSNGFGCRFLIEELLYLFLLVR